MKSIFLFLLLLLCTGKIFAQTKTKQVVTQISDKVSLSPNLQLKPQTDKLPIKVGRTIEFTTKEASWIDVDISPDGSTILFSCLGEIFSLPAKGGIATQLTRGLAINRCPLWSPDGKLIAYESDATGFVGLHVTNLTGSFHKVLTEENYPGFKLMWLPDSKQIANGYHVYSLTGAASYLPRIKGRVLGFSPDGRFCYFQEDISPDSSAIVKYDRSNLEKTRLFILNGQDCNNARISPDGAWFIYIKCKTLDPGDHLYSPADSLMAIDMKTGQKKIGAFKYNV